MANETDELATLRGRVKELEAEVEHWKGEYGGLGAVAKLNLDAADAENARLRNLLRETRGAWWRDTDLPRELFDDLPLVKQIRITLARTEAENG